jgi:hypothetical protein
MNETQNNRRDFFKEAGKRALWAAPTVTLLMTAASQPALATKNGYGTHSYKTYKKKKYSGSKSSKSSKKKSYKGSR